MNTQKISFFIKNFIDSNNSMRAKNDQVTGDNLQLAIANLIDRNGDGNVTPKEIGEFFYHIWDNKENRKQLGYIGK